MCRDCGECVVACPTGALAFKDEQGIVKSGLRKGVKTGAMPNF